MLSCFSGVQLFVIPVEHNPQVSYVCPWDYLGKNTGVGCHFLLQGIFPALRSNLKLLCLPYWQVGSLPLVLKTGKKDPLKINRLGDCVRSIQTNMGGSVDGSLWQRKKTVIVISTQ